MDSSVFEVELNHFLRGHRVLSVKRELVSDEGKNYWCLCVEYLDLPSGGENQETAFWQKKDRVDYREILSEEEFTRVAKMRSVRKSIAESDHIPAYTIMKDEQMAELAKMSVVDEKSLKAFSGFGEKKFEKYGVRFLEGIREKGNEAGGKSVSENQQS